MFPVLGSTDRVRCNEVAVSKELVIGAEYPFLKPAELGETVGESRVVAERSQITQAVGDALPLRARLPKKDRRDSARSETRSTHPAHPSSPTANPALR